MVIQKYLKKFQIRLLNAFPSLSGYDTRMKINAMQQTGIIILKFRRGIPSDFLLEIYFKISHYKSQYEIHFLFRKVFQIKKKKHR